MKCAVLIHEVERVRRRFGIADMALVEIVDGKKVGKNGQRIQADDDNEREHRQPMAAELAPD